MAYLVKLSVLGRKDGGRTTAVEMPAFFRYTDDIEDVREYVADQFKHVVSVYIEFVPEDGPDGPVET